MGEPLASLPRFVKRSSRKLARSTFYGMSRWQAKLERKQAGVLDPSLLVADSPVLDSR